jgi:tRNA 2-thiouridine synthesizing protein E
MKNISVGGVVYELLADGRLANNQDWNENIAAGLAEKDGITLTHKHWEIINLMRDFYKQYNISPIRKLLIKSIMDKYENKKASNDYLDNLFPNGVLIEGSKIAGIPIPMLDAELNENDRYNCAAKRNAKSRVDPSLTSHYIDKFDYDGKIYAVTDNGNLKDASQWNEQIAIHMANKEGIILSSDHWEVINYLRKFYFEYGLAPMVRLLMKYMKEQCGPEKSSEDYLYKLFPQGPSKQGCRLGGLPEPQGCID